MMEDLKELGKPLEFWEYFYEISKIPRCSGYEDQMRVFIQKEAEKMGFQTMIDQIKNIVIKIPSKLKSEKSRVILQSHMDMVCEKNDDVKHDFSKDPLDIKLIKINNEKWITANGTTLGADNAVGMAYQLALMKKIYKGELDLGPISIDLLFTVDEERGLIGASQIDKNMISGSYMINLDSEEENRFTIGAAGGRIFEVIVKDGRKSVDKEKEVIPMKLSVIRLVGGHSGGDINKGRANALKIISQILWKLKKKYNIYLNSLNGGNLDNAIPREAEAIFFIEENDLSKITNFINNNSLHIKMLYNGIESNMEILIQKLEDFNDYLMISRELQNRLIDLLFSMPNGPISIHPITKELVHTSTNLSSIRTEKNSINFVISQRSLTQYEQDILYERFLTLFEISGLDLNVNIKYEYPSWPPNFSSKISKLSRKIYKELFDNEVIIQAIHAGLECAYFVYHYPNMEIISIGPDITDVHSPDERLKIKSVERIWNFLIALLKKLV
ncbi:MAG: beta-Ala-His dipeptidase [Candidatus Hermodarchaeota archaeon]